MSKVDFHIHTTASDGIMSPLELVDHAILNEVRFMAITDHDTVSGIDSALKYSASKSVKIIPGIEFSIKWKPGRLHIVGLNIDHNNDRLNQELEILEVFRKQRATKIIQELQKHGISIEYEEVLSEAKGDSIGKPHIARVLIKNGYAESMEEVFLKFLDKGLLGHVKKQKISMKKAIKLIRGAGGIPIVAHPATLGIDQKKEFKLFVEEFISLGGMGIEVYAYMHSDEQVQMYLEIANSKKMFISGGSDFHGDKDDIIGYYGKERLIPYSLSEQF
jgi:predicted metal-dependent phosphoesterase TrpH